jgi:hypothetical protein
MARMSLDDNMMRAVELDLARAPEAHPIIRGLRGVRKARFLCPDVARVVVGAPYTMWKPDQLFTC